MVTCQDCWERIDRLKAASLHFSVQKDGHVWVSSTVVMWRFMTWWLCLEQCVTSQFGARVKSRWEPIYVTKHLRPELQAQVRLWYFNFARNLLRKYGSIYVKLIEHNLKVHIVAMFVVADWLASTVSQHCINMLMFYLCDRLQTLAITIGRRASSPNFACNKMSPRKKVSYFPLSIMTHLGDRNGTVVKVLCYKSEGRWFDSRWCHWNFSLT